MSNTLKDDKTDICEKHTINESDLIRRAIATFVENLKGQTETRPNTFLFDVSHGYKTDITSH